MPPRLYCPGGCARTKLGVGRYSEVTGSRHNNGDSISHRYNKPMQHSEQPYIELKKASAAIDAMRGSKSLVEFEEGWKTFLNRIERVWNKASHHFGKSPKWNGWKGQYEKARKDDALLSYLVNARGADEHTVNEITGTEPAGVAINAAEGNSLYIDYMKINSGHVFIKSPQKLRIDFRPDRTKLLPVINRGREYSVPQTHMGAAIDPTNLVSLAELTVAYYEAFLTRAEAFFVK